jgi:phosphoserine phosphatase RsbU/P
MQLTNQETAQENDLSDIYDLEEYLYSLIHSWLKTLTTLGFTLVPLFFLLDYFIIPRESIHLLPRFGFYRAVSTAFVILQFVILLKTKPGKFSLLHGYFFNLVVSLAIVLMTVDLGGFDAPYYAGLNLVIIAVNLLPPWHPFHSALNGIFTIILYLTFNLLFSGNFNSHSIINNLYFMAATVIIASSINYVKFILVKKEFFSRKDLRAARDALWSEMEIAKKIQTALLPSLTEFGDYKIASTMIPAEEVGGDYYDLIDTGNGLWVIIGDVSGHGVESGLIMMMTQTGIKSVITENPDSLPSTVLSRVNRIIKENIERLQADRYMTINAIHFTNNKLIHAGKHQDILVYRKATDTVEVCPSYGTWIGILDDLDKLLPNTEILVHPGDVILLFTDGITELFDPNGNLFGEDMLAETLKESSHLSAEEIKNTILKRAKGFCASQEDDITLVVIQKIR